MWKQVFFRWFKVPYFISIADTTSDRFCCFLMTLAMYLTPPALAISVFWVLSVDPLNEALVLSTAALGALFLLFTFGAAPRQSSSEDVRVVDITLHRAFKEMLSDGYNGGIDIYSKLEQAFSDEIWSVRMDLNHITIAQIQWLNRRWKKTIKRSVKEIEKKYRVHSNGSLINDTLNNQFSRNAVLYVNALKETHNSPSDSGKELKLLKL